MIKEYNNSEKKYKKEEIVYLEHQLEIILDYKM
jgi:hypothetical protein